VWEGHHVADTNNGGTGGDDDESSSTPSHISQRLSRRGRGVSTAQLFSSFTATPVLSAPGGDIFIYIGCGMRRGTDFAMQLAAVTNTGFRQTFEQPLKHRLFALHL